MVNDPSAPRDAIGRVCPDSGDFVATATALGALCDKMLAVVPAPLVARLLRQIADEMDPPKPMANHDLTEL